MFSIIPDTGEKAIHSPNISDLFPFSQTERIHTEMALLGNSVSCHHYAISLLMAIGLKPKAKAVQACVYYRQVMLVSLNILTSQIIKNGCPKTPLKPYIVRKFLKKIY